MPSTPQNPLPQCPVCGTNKGAKAQSGYFRCGKCGGLYDDKPLEGGDVYADPSRRMELQERQRQRRKERRR